MQGRCPLRAGHGPSPCAPAAHRDAQRAFPLTCVKGTQPTLTPARNSVRPDVDTLPNVPDWLDVDDLRTRVQAALDAFVEAQQPVLADVSCELAPVLAALTELLAGGKR